MYVHFEEYTLWKNVWIVIVYILISRILCWHHFPFLKLWFQHVAKSSSFFCIKTISDQKNTRADFKIYKLPIIIPFRSWVNRVIVINKAIKGQFKFFTLLLLLIGKVYKYLLTRRKKMGETFSVIKQNLPISPKQNIVIINFKVAAIFADFISSMCQSRLKQSTPWTWLIWVIYYLLLKIITDIGDNWNYDKLWVHKIWTV